MKKFVIALDSGTTSNRAVLFDHHLEIKGIAQQEFEQFYPQSGWVEHDALEIWRSQYEVLQEVLAANDIEPEAIAAIGITNQRETTIVWNKRTGLPLCHAIVWQDRRTADYCQELKKRNIAPLIREKPVWLWTHIFQLLK